MHGLLTHGVTVIEVLIINTTLTMLTDQTFLSTMCFNGHLFVNFNKYYRRSCYKIFDVYYEKYEN